MTSLERNDLHAAIEQRYPDNMSQDITPELLRDGLHDLVDSLFVKATDVNPSGGVYLRLRNGKTLWHLGAGVRDKTKLRLRKFGAGTLPAILPAPVLDPDRPRIAAPGTAFPLHPAIGGPATGPAAIAEYTRQVSDGDHVVLTGTALAQATYPVYQNGNFYATSVTEQDFEKAAVRLPRVGAAWDAALTWPATAAGIGLPVLLNTARVKWEQDVWAPGLAINIFGENLAHSNQEGGAGYVAIRQGNGPVRLYDATAANPYRASFNVPATVVPGPLEYWYHNGHGGEYGWSAKRTVTVVAATDHVLLHNFGPATVLALSATDAAANDATLAANYVQNKHIAIKPGPWPISATVVVPSYSKLSCTDPTKTVQFVTTASWLQVENRGMLGTNYAEMAVVENVELLNPYDAKLGGSEALVVLNNLNQVWLKGGRARWTAPYTERQAGPVKEAVPVQPLRLATSKNVFFDDLTLTGSGVLLGSSSQVFLTNYTHRATNNADYMLYSLNMLGWAMIGYDLRDLDPASTDGVNRGIRCIKSGGQGGRNRYRHLEKGIGTDLGIMRSGTNQAPDDNQFEQDLDEYNITLYTDKVVSATANTVTVPRTLIVQVNNQPVRLVKPDEHLVAIVAGRGVGQWRGVVSTTVNTITVDEPWLVEPDATSVLHTGWFSCDSTRYDVHYTAKPDNARNPLYNHGAFYNGFGGVRGGIIDKCSGDGFRQGISLVATQHDSDKVDQTAFNVVRNSSFPNSRWGRRFEAVPGQAGWVFDVPGLYCNLFSNCTYEHSILAPLVYQLPRDTAGPVPSIAMLVEENQPVDVGRNDYTPSFVDDPKFPPVPPLAGTIAASRQLVRQAQVAPTAPGVQLVSGDEIGPLEPLPAGAAVDSTNGVLSYPGTDPAVLVYVEGAQEIPLARTPVASASTPVVPGPGTTYTAGAGIDITGNVISATVAAPTPRPLISTATVLKFDDFYEHAPIAAGTFTVDLTGRTVGKEVKAFLAPTASDPSANLPATDFQRIGNGTYQAGASLMYTFHVGANGKIQYIITELL